MGGALTFFTFIALFHTNYIMLETTVIVPWGAFINDVMQI